MIDEDGLFDLIRKVNAKSKPSAPQAGSSKSSKATTTKSSKAPVEIVNSL